MFLIGVVDGSGSFAETPTCCPCYHPQVKYDLFNILFVIRLGTSAQPVFGRHGFKPRLRLNFFQCSIFAISLIAVYLMMKINSLLRSFYYLKEIEQVDKILFTR